MTCAALFVALRKSSKKIVRTSKPMSCDSTDRQNTQQGIHMGMESFGGLAFFAPVLRKS